MHFTTEAQRAQSFILLTAPAALLTIQSFSLCPLCLCGESFFDLFLNWRYWPILLKNSYLVAVKNI